MANYNITRGSSRTSFGDDDPRVAAIRAFNAQRAQEQADAAAVLAEVRGQGAAERAARQSTPEARALAEQRVALAQQGDAALTQAQQGRRSGDIEAHTQGLRAAFRSKSAQAYINHLEADANGHR